LKQRVTEVVTATNNAEPSNETREAIRSITGRAAMVTNTKKETIQKSPYKRYIESHNGSQHDLSSCDDQGLFQDSPSKPNLPGGRDNSNERQCSEENRQRIHESLSKSSMSWDADFSQFNIFSSGKSSDQDFPGFSKNTTNIDLLLHNPCSPLKKQSEIPKPLPKIKEPPFSYPRNVWARAQIHAARFETDVTEHQTEISPAVSDCSSDIFYSLEDSVAESEPAKTKIEERMERAMCLQNDSFENPNTPIDTTQYEDSSMLESPSQRKLINQFRGCVKFLLD